MFFITKFINKDGKIINLKEAAAAAPEEEKSTSNTGETSDTGTESNESDTNTETNQEDTSKILVQKTMISRILNQKI